MNTLEKNKICLTINRLISEKSRRDNINFTASQLAEAIGVHRSVIAKLIQEDLNKRVINPKIDTLIKIATYFKKDGFNITLDEFFNI